MISVCLILLCCFFSYLAKLHMLEVCQVWCAWNAYGDYKWCHIHAGVLRIFIEQHVNECPVFVDRCFARKHRKRRLRTNRTSLLVLNLIPVGVVGNLQYDDLDTLFWNQLHVQTIHPNNLMMIHQDMPITIRLDLSRQNENHIWFWPKAMLQRGACSYRLQMIAVFA